MRHTDITTACSSATRAHDGITCSCCACWPRNTVWQVLMARYGKSIALLAPSVVLSQFRIFCLKVIHADGNRARVGATVHSRCAHGRERTSYGDARYLQGDYLMGVYSLWA